MGFVGTFEQGVPCPCFPIFNNYFYKKQSLYFHNPNICLGLGFQNLFQPIVGRPKLCSFIINEWMMMGVLGAYTIRNFTYARLLKKGVFISIVHSYIIFYGEASKKWWTHHKNYVFLSNFRSPGPYFQLFLY